MAESSGLDIFERAVEARARLLRVEADRAGAAPELLVVTFDVGRVIVRPDEEGLRIDHIESPEAMPEGLVAFDEAEPWWRLMGQPITAAWPGGVEDGVGARGLGALMVLKLRFREEAENPRIVLVEAAGSKVRVSLEDPPPVSA